MQMEFIMHKCNDIKLKLKTCTIFKKIDRWFNDVERWWKGFWNPVLKSFW